MKMAALESNEKSEYLIAFFRSAGRGWGLFVCASAAVTHQHSCLSIVASFEIYLHSCDQALPLPIAHSLVPTNVYFNCPTENYPLIIPSKEVAPISPGISPFALFHLYCPTFRFFDTA
jgi:hypothetical protein